MRLIRWILVASSFAVAMLTLACARQQAADTSTMPGPISAEDKVKRGQYLVTVVGCGDCHTPGTLYGAPDMARMLSGSDLGWVGPWGTAFARNLTPDSTGLGAWTEDQIATAIRTGARPDGRQLAPIMPWANLSHMTDEDVYAIVAFLKSLPAVSHRVPDPVPPGKKLAGSSIVIPPPPAWDAPRVAPDTTRRS